MKIGQHIRDCLDEYENTINACHQGLYTQEHADVIDYFPLNLAKALMQDVPAEKVAKIILASKGLSDINVKVE